MTKKRIWLIITGTPLILITYITGLTMDVPQLPVLKESIRNVFFHSSIWFALLALIAVNTFYSVRLIKTEKLTDFHYVIPAFESSLYLMVVVSIAGILTGSVWARFTWGSFWTSDPKLNGIAYSFILYLIVLLIYRSDNTIHFRKISGMLSLLANLVFIVAVIILPRFTESLHPGTSGSPAFFGFSLDNKLRIVFYPAAVGWILVSLYLWSILTHYKLIKNKINNHTTKNS